jgi:hypothetical protein
MLAIVVTLLVLVFEGSVIVVKLLHFWNIPSIDCTLSVLNEEMSRLVRLVLLQP